MRRHGSLTGSEIKSVPVTDPGDALAGLAPAYEAQYRRLLTTLGEDSRVRAILLTGSVARGNADAYSDLDLGVIVEAGTVVAVAERCAALIGPVAHSTTIERGPVVVFSALTVEALRIDVLVEPVSVATKRRRRPHRVLVHLDGLSESLRTVEDRSRSADPEPVVAEFIRVLGLLDVVIGREEYFVGAQGVMLLRDLLIDLFYVENGRMRNSGRKRLNDELTAEQRSLLAAQPVLSHDRSAVIEGHRAAAEVFLPRARAIFDARDLEWPETLTRVVQERLQGLIDISALALG